VATDPDLVLFSGSYQFQEPFRGVGMSAPFLLYHWSPVARRKSILRKGLCPGSRSRCGQWHPPYVCFSPWPSMAWGVSALMGEDYGQWDLWMVWSNRLKGYEKLQLGSNREYRVYHRIPKRDIWHVGTREYKPKKSTRERL